MFNRSPIILVCISGLLLTGCTGSGAENDPDGTEAISVAFVPGSTTSQFYVSMIEGAEEAAQELEVDLVVQGASEFSPTEQTPIVNALATRDLDALIIAPTDAESMFAPINALHESGTKVITVDTQLENSSIVAAQITASNEQGGSLAADHMADLVDVNEGKIAILGLNPAATTINDRAAGFSDRITEEHPGFEVLPTEYVSGSDPSEAQTTTEALLLAHDDLVGIFAPNQPAAEGAAAGLRSQGATGIPIIGYDSSERQVDLLRSGDISALVLQQPALEGRLAVEAAYAAETGDTYEELTTLENILVDSEQADDPEFEQYFY